MNRSPDSLLSQLGRASVGASVAIVVVLAAAVGLAVVLKRGGPTAPSDSAGAAEPAPEARGANPASAAGERAPVPDASAAVAIPKLVDLGAGKCIPCKLMAPILEALRKDFAGRLDVVFIDVWENPDEAKKYGIKLIPTQIFYDATGKELFRHEGFYSREDILAKWKELGVDLASGPPEIVREEPLVKDERPAEKRCSLCDGDVVAETAVVVEAPEGTARLCSPHCFFIYRTSHRDPGSLAGKVSVTDGASGGPIPAETASYLYETDESGRPAIRAFADEDTAMEERRRSGGEVLSWAALGAKEEAVRCAFCDRATYPADSPKVNVDGSRKYACCVLCGLGVAARARKDIELEAYDGLTGAAIRVKTAGGRVDSLEPPTSVAWFGQKRDAEGKMVSAGCFKQRFFASVDDLKAWLEKHPSATGRMITIQKGLDDKMKLSPEQIASACKIGECAPPDGS